ncbi:MAG: DUF2834 domain-containing protein [Pseudomonadota bacterium]
MDFSRSLYLVLMLVALAFPVRRLANWIQEYGLDYQLMAQALTVNDPARSLTGAIFVTSLAALVFMVGEAFTRRDWLSLIAVPVTLTLGVAVGLPLYLFLRLRTLR